MFTQKWMDTYFTEDVAIQIGISLCILLLFLLFGERYLRSTYFIFSLG